ncbi:MAG: division/cell wall cluster transcriptional repressor MraZ [Nanoarchaeota archaeon]|nr:division/cell wall cluster transcriptional repressor MraZ [Patescibacteria group bacterium]MCG2719727.1 division/cell wall cluster transcriptional repressor MraZ [Nanoarchaeota archaeon]
MFIGEYKHNLDSKGRIALPVKFRQEIGSSVIITKGLDRCLFAFTSKDWEILAQKLVKLPLVQSNSRAFVRLMVAGAMSVEPDKQGRILIPDYLRQYADFKKEVVVAGVYNRIEIWNNDTWNDYKSKTEASSDEIAEKLGELGI